jgi:Domain of unknown function (DUF3597)
MNTVHEESWLHKLVDAVFHPHRSGDAMKALEEKAANHPELHWKTSVIDLMKLVGQDSSPEARIRLARELHYHGALDGSDAMNEFLHEKVLERLGIQWVTYKNTDEQQTHHFLDRFKQQHDILPGQTIEMDMAVDEVEAFVKRARYNPNRLRRMGPKELIGKPFDPHPVIILGLGPIAKGLGLKDGKLTGVSDEDAQRLNIKIEPDMNEKVADLETKLAAKEIELNEMAAKITAQASQPKAPQGKQS